MTRQAPIVAGRFLKDAEPLGEPRFESYEPRFDIECDGESVVWIRDCGHRIALLHKTQHGIDLFEFTPGQQRISAQLPGVYHAPTLLGAHLTTVIWVHGRGMGRSSDSIDYRIRTDRGGVTVLVHECWHDLGLNSVAEFRVGIDPHFGYVVHTKHEIRGEREAGIEVMNFLPAGATHSLPGRDRFPYLLWHNDSLGLLKWHSNQVSMRMPGQGIESPVRRLAADGWLGYLGERDWNPVYAFSRTSQPIASATCPNLLDEHLTFVGAPARDDEGLFKWSCEGALFSCPADVSDRLVARATENALGAESEAEARNLRCFPFIPGQPSDFEKTIALDTYYRGLYWAGVSTGGDGPAAVTDWRSHSGGRSLQLRATDEEQAVYSTGASLWLPPTTRYRFSAWVFHEGPGTMEFRLAVWQAIFDSDRPVQEDEARTSLSNCAAWTRVSLEFCTVEPEAALHTGLHWSGSGSLFVDDILLEEIESNERAYSCHENRDRIQ